MAKRTTKAQLFKQLVVHRYLLIFAVGLLIGSLIFETRALYEPSVGVDILGSGNQFEYNNRTWLAIPAPVIDVIVLIDSIDCGDWCQDTDTITSLQKQITPTLNFREVEATSPEGRLLREQFIITALPAYIFDKKIEQLSSFVKLRPHLSTKRDNQYLLDPDHRLLTYRYYFTSPEIDDAYVLGSAEAPITLTEFSDYQCPYSYVSFSQTFPAIKKKYIDTGKIRYAFADFPLDFHQHARRAHLYAQCASQQENYWAVHDALFATQAQWKDSKTTPYSVWSQSVRRLGFDTSLFESCLASPDYSRIQASVDLGKEFDVSGTPTFFINNKKVVGTMDESILSALIDEELARTARSKKRP